MNKSETNRVLISFQVMRKISEDEQAKSLDMLLFWSNDMTPQNILRVMGDLRESLTAKGGLFLPISQSSEKVIQELIAECQPVNPPTSCGRK